MSPELICIVLLSAWCLLESLSNLKLQKRVRVLEDFLTVLKPFCDALSKMTPMSAQTTVRPESDVQQGSVSDA